MHFTLQGKTKNDSYRRIVLCPGQGWQGLHALRQ